jgi:hypothetical protein
MDRAWQELPLLMSIQLPRNLKELHFTGSVKALAPVRPSSALGQERPKSPLPPPPKPVRSADVYAVDVQPTPYVGARPSERAEAAKPIKLATTRGQLASMDEDLLTEALDRDEIDAALFPVARRANASLPAPNLPVPHFRSAAEAKAHHAEPAIIVRKQPQGGNLPLGMWLMAALAAGIVAYQLAPQAAASVSELVRSYEHAPQ